MHDAQDTCQGDSGGAGFLAKVWGFQVVGLLVVGPILVTTFGFSSKASYLKDRSTSNTARSQIEASPQSVEQS